MKAVTIKGNSADEISTGLAASTANGFSPTLALVFLSVKQDRRAITTLLQQKGIAVFGATTAGEFTDGEIGEGSVVIMLLDLKPAAFHIQFEQIGDSNLEEVAKKIGRDGRQTFGSPAFLVSYSGLFTDGEVIVKGIEEGAGSGVAIYGGMAGDDLTFNSSCVFTNNEASDKGIIAVIIDNEKVALKGHATGGWKPVGTERTITRSEGRIVYTMDDEPALDVVLKYMGIDPKTTEEVNDAMLKMGPYFPILLHREDGDLVTRTAMLASIEEKSLTYSGSVPQGAKFRFALPPDFEVTEEVVAKTQELQTNGMPEADAVVMFSCVARLVSLGPMVSEEIEGVKNIWKSPLAGFFSYGEIGKAKNGNHEYYNNTCCLVALKENEPAKTKEQSL